LIAWERLSSRDQLNDRKEQSRLESRSHGNTANLYFISPKAGETTTLQPFHEAVFKPGLSLEQCQKYCINDRNHLV